MASSPRPAAARDALRREARQPQGTLASMGIYVFRRDVLRSWLEQDARRPELQPRLRQGRHPAHGRRRRRTSSPTRSRATGWTWARSRPTGRRTCTCWCMPRRWISTTAAGSSTPEARSGPRRRSRPGRWSSAASSATAASSRAPSIARVLSPAVYVGPGRPSARLDHSQRHTHRGGRHRRPLHSRQADRRRLGLYQLAVRQTSP